MPACGIDLSCSLEQSEDNLCISPPPRSRRARKATVHQAALTLAFGASCNTNGVNTAYAILTPLNGLPSLYTINLQTGAATSIGTLGFTNQVYSLAVVTIPAPGAGAMLAMGLLAGARRSRRR